MGLVLTINTKSSLSASNIMKGAENPSFEGGKSFRVLNDKINLKESYVVLTVSNCRFSFAIDSVQNMDGRCTTIDGFRGNIVFVCFF